MEKQQIEVLTNPSVEQWTFVKKNHTPCWDQDINDPDI